MHARQEIKAVHTGQVGSVTISTGMRTPSICNAAAAVGTRAKGVFGGNTRAMLHPLPAGVNGSTERKERVCPIGSIVRCRMGSSPHCIVSPPSLGDRLRPRPVVAPRHCNDPVGTQPEHGWHAT